MSTAILRKHCMELWRRWLFVTAFGLLPGIAAALSVREGSHHPSAVDVPALFIFLVLAFFPTGFGGTGLTASMGARPQRGADPSLLFTLSLPVRRRTLFFYRSVFGLLGMETAAAAAWAITGLLVGRVGVSWHVLVPALWVLPVLVPFYFLDSLLLIRFSEIATVQVQAIALMILWFGLIRLGVPLGKIAEDALQHFTPLPVALATCVLSAAFAATTVWRLDRQNY
jgi:hypothetical protein